MSQQWQFVNGEEFRSSYAVGKTNHFVNESLVYDPATPRSLISDALRQYVGKFYRVRQDGLLAYANESERAMLIVKEPTDPDNALRTATHLRFKFSSPPPAGDEDGTMRYEAFCRDNIDTNVTYSDYSFIRQLPIGLALASKMQAAARLTTMDAQAHHKLYVPTYEKFLRENPSMPENALPSFYALYAQGIYLQRNVEGLNSLGGTVSAEDAVTDKFISTADSEHYYANSTQTDVVKDKYISYYEAFADGANKLIKREGGRERLNTLASQNNVYTFTEEAIGGNLLSTEAVKGERFPLFNKIEFSTDKNSQLADALFEMNVGPEIIKEVLHSRQQRPFTFGRSSENLVRSNRGSMPPYSRFTYGSTQIRSWDLKRWLMAGMFNNGGIPGIMIGLQPHPNSLSELRMDQGMMRQILGATINNISKREFRTIKKMFNGKPAYSEAVFYMIQKFSEDNLTTPISTYFIPNSKKLGECTFIDTQVKYGKKYAYSIISYVMVLGNEYQYRNATQINSTTCKFGIGNISKMKLFEIPISFVRNVMVLDSPPMPPEVSIVSFKHIGNKIMINMNGSTGDRVMKPVIIEAVDKENFERQRISQRLLGNKIRFKSDDSPGSFEVFRTTTKPSSYSDFAGKKIRTIFTADPQTGDLASSGAFKDDITTDVKYYYAIRSLDVHGNVSNPSPVYEVEMKSSAGPPYMTLNTIDFKEKEIKNKKPFKSMRRYVQIIPTTTQGLLDVEGSRDLQGVTSAKDVEEVSLGVADEKLWGRRFRIRFTSKKTGRKIDLDVNFGIKHKVNQT